MKYKTYSLKGCWSEDELLNIAEYLVKKNLFVYCWYWDSQNHKRQFKELSETELHAFLTGREERYLAIYFSQEPFEKIPVQVTSGEKGILIPNDIWRKHNIVMLQSPFMILFRGLYCQMDFCSEYLDKEGNIVPKSASFSALIEDFRKYSKKLLKK